MLYSQKNRRRSKYDCSLLFVGSKENPLPTGVSTGGTLLWKYSDLNIFSMFNSIYFNEGLLMKAY